MTDQDVRPARDPARDRDTLAEIQAALATDRNRAIDLAIKALGDDLEHPLVLHLVAQGLEEDGRAEDALPLLMWARSLAPDDVTVINGQGLCLAALGRWDEAVAAYDEALAVQPDFMAAMMNKGAAQVAMKRAPLAEQTYQRAAEMFPASPEPVAALAGLAARHGDAAAARRHAEAAIAIDPALPGPHIALVQADLADRDFAAAETRARRLIQHPRLTFDQRAQAFGLLGDALDGLDRTAEAFGAYQQSNQQLEPKVSAFLRAGEEPALAAARRVTAFVSALPANAWRPAPAPARPVRPDIRGHVFLMGFPRSGTTLLEQVLASHPDVVSLEERPMLEMVAKPLMLDAAQLEHLGRMTGEEADSHREVYWSAAKYFAEGDLTGKVVIDKNPLATLHLPVIARLFPEAKILFALRDPRDVVLSCFRRRFRLNASTAEFLKIERAAGYYDAVFELAETCFRKFNFARLTVRHEDFVDDFDEQAAAVLRWLGLDWDPAVRGFASRARNANTPSAKQLAGGLSRESLGQWRRYERQLAPVMGRLTPWAARFGYEVDQAAATAPGQNDPSLETALSDVQAALRAGAMDGAFRVAERALAAGLRHPLLFRLRGVANQQSGRLGEAIADFEAALEATPNDPAVLNALGLCLARNGRPGEGLARLDASIAQQPAFAPAHFNRGWTLEALGRLGEAADAYRRAIEIDPRHAPSHGALAVLASRAADWAGARRHAEAALTLDPQTPAAHVAIAEADLAAGRAADAERRLRALLASPRVSGHEQAVALRVLGDALDRLDRPGDAFQAYAEAGRRLNDIHGPVFQASGGEPTSQLVERLLDSARATGAGIRRARGPGRQAERAAPVFLMGFPRSGTTLAGQILVGHPDAVTLDERETLSDATRHFFAAGRDLRALAEAEDAELDRFRDLYWRRVETALGGATPERIIDKLPMNTLALPLIQALFPDARVVFMQRDPRDTVLSCFQRQFAINPTTIDLLSLEGAARLYDRVMELATLYRSALDLPLRTQVYEALVNDFDTEGRALAEFAGLDWRPEMAAFAARAGDVATPSGPQLARGLTAESVGRWRRYREPMAPVLPLLAPWVERFGYPAD